MMYKRITASFLFTYLLSGAAFAAEIVQSDAAVPPDLLAFSAENGCQPAPVSMLTDRGIEGAPYIYGVATLIGSNEQGTMDESAVIWCERLGEGYERFDLLVKMDDGEPWPGGCTSKIDAHDRVGALTIATDLNEPLEWYWHIPGDRAVPVDAGRIAGPVIVSSRGGIKYHFYCHEGRWLGQLLH